MTEEDRKNRKCYLEEIRKRNGKNHHATCFLVAPSSDNITKNMKK